MAPEIMPGSKVTEDVKKVIKESGGLPKSNFVVVINNPLENSVVFTPFTLGEHGNWRKKAHYSKNIYYLHQPVNME